MKWFLDLKTSAKLSMGFGISIFLTCLVGYFGFSGISQLNKVQNALATDALPGTALAGTLGADVRDLRRTQMRIGVSTNATEAKGYINALKACEDEFQKNAEQYEKTINYDADRKNFETLKNAHQANLDFTNKMIAFAQKGDMKAAREILDNESKAQYEKELIPACDKLTKWNIDEGETMSKTAAATSSAAFRSILMVTVFAIAIAVFFAWFIGRLVNRTLSMLGDRFVSLTNENAADLKNAIEALERYDLTATLTPVTQPIPISSKDDLSQMAGTFNTLLAMFVSAMDSFRNAQGALTGIVGQLNTNARLVNDTSASLTTATDQTGRASTEIANGSEKLALSASEAAATMEKLVKEVSQVKQSSEKQYEGVTGADAQLKAAAEVASRVAQSAENVVRVAKEGKNKVDDIISSNQQINEQVALSAEKVTQLDAASEQIGAIVQSIEQIAEQTNLLALNAAIEAARAGEHGRGFAVVAEEVRKLAEQAGSATKEIVSLIENVRRNVTETVSSINSTVPLVEAGTSLTREAGVSLGEIAEAALTVASDANGVAATGADVAMTMDKIREAAIENNQLTERMAAGATQVSSAIQGVAAISEETAASAEEMNATAEEVSASATELNSMASELNSVVAKFKIDHTSSTRTAGLKLAA